MMEEMRKAVVIAKDVAEAVGCSLATVRNYRTAPNLVSEKMKERIRHAMEELGYDPHAVLVENGKRSAALIKNGPYAKIAQKLGLSYYVVYNTLKYKAGGKHAEEVLAAAKEIGFEARPLTPEEKELRKRERYERMKEKERKKAEEKFALLHAGFKNREEQNAYMRYMRSVGYSNVQISRKVGLHVLTVRRRIGPQPKDMSKGNVVAAQKHRAAENHRRKVYADTHLVAEYNQLIVECGQLRAQAEALISQSDAVLAKLADMKPKVEKAKLSTVEPEQLPSFQPVIAHMPEILQ